MPEDFHKPKPTDFFDETTWQAIREGHLDESRTYSLFNSHVLNEQERQWLYAHNLSLTDLVNGRYTVVYEDEVNLLFVTWNERIGYTFFFPTDTSSMMNAFGDSFGVTMPTDNLTQQIDPDEFLDFFNEVMSETSEAKGMMDFRWYLQMRGWSYVREARLPGLCYMEDPVTGERIRNDIGVNRQMFRDGILSGQFDSSTTMMMRVAPLPEPLRTEVMKYRAQHDTKWNGYTGNKNHQTTTVVIKEDNPVATEPSLEWVTPQFWEDDRD